MRFCINGILAALAWGALNLSAFSATTLPAEVQTVLSSRCAGCHGAKVQMAGLDLQDAARILTGSQNGPVVSPGSPDSSLLIKRVREGSMPPGGVKNKLPAAEIAVLENWVKSIVPDAGLPIRPASAGLNDEDRTFWSFLPLAHPAPPAVEQSGLVSTAVDNFLLAQLEKKKLQYSPVAAKATLIRRAYLDLTGLPPTPAEVENFMQDRGPDAYRHLLDRLLASAQFGERWGRHWLDLAGYVDTVGRDVQSGGYKVGEGRWKYRDYVVKAFNQDKPYNQFLTEQIAGDELFDWRNAREYSPKQVEMLTATGYLRTVEDPTDAAERDLPLQRYEVLHQTIDILSSSVMGLTVACSRCHNHKFDPITQKDYYGLMAVLSPAYNPVKWTPVLERKLADVPPAVKSEMDAFNDGLNKQIGALQAQRDELLQKPVLALIEDPLKALPEAAREKTRKAALNAPRKRNAAQKRLLEALKVDLSEKALCAKLDPADRDKAAELETGIQALTSKLRKYGLLEALYDTGPAPEIFIHRRGDFESKGPVVEASGLEVLSKPGFDLQTVARTEDGGSKPRLALAQWLTAEGTPAASLVARVYVNRAWMHLMGQAIVGTPENFGKMGARPTHPQLLDWLASDFVNNGWSTKHLIRTIMLSRAYQQTSLPADNPAGLTVAQKADPDNSLFWHMPIRRLESEVIRDSMLAVAGSLNRKAGGPPVQTIAQPDGMVVVDNEQVSDPAERNRRSIYLVARRRYNLTLLNVFDHPVMSTNAVARGSSAVVLQSLVMMNDQQVLDQADRFASRLLSETKHATDSERIDLGYRYAFGRKPAPDELQWTLALLEREQNRYASAGKTPADARTEALAAVCQVLLNANEFLYVE